MGVCACWWPSSARPARFRPEITIDGRVTRVLVEQTAALDAETRLAKWAGHLSPPNNKLSAKP